MYINMYMHVINVTLLACLVILCCDAAYSSKYGNYPNNPYGSYGQSYNFHTSYSGKNSIELPENDRGTMGCRAKGLCCEGKNNTCVAKGPKMNDPNEEICFCDSSCRLLGDCCTDYDRYCTAVDCVLGRWQQWGECDTNCGWGHKHRRRQILRAPRNGGQACEKMTEKQRCYGWGCKVARNSFSLEELRETAKIIPAQYGGHRKSKTYSPFEDIRRNLFHHYSGNEIVKRPPYCARFQVTSSRHSCQSAPQHWAARLQEGSTVCVECQQYAMKKRLGIRCKGHGVFRKETAWTAMTVHGCHGEWMMLEQHHECRCNPHRELSLILV